MDRYNHTITLNNMAIRVRTNKHPRKIGQPKAIGYANKLHSPATDLEALIEWAGPATLHILVDRIVELRKQYPNSVFKIEQVL